MKPMNGLLPLPAFHILALLTLLFQTLSPSLLLFTGERRPQNELHPIQQSRPSHRARLLAEAVEPSPLTPETAAAPHLTLTAAPLTLPAAGSDNTHLSVTVSNSGAEVARRVRLFIEGADYVAAGSVFVGDIAAGETRAVRAPLQLTGRRYTAPVYLLLTAVADNQPARPQTVTTLTFLPPGLQSLNALSYLSAPDGINADVRVEPVTVRFAAADDPAFWLRFRLHNWPETETGAAPLLEWHLAEYAGEFPLDQTALQLTYQSAANNFVAVPIPFTYHEQRHTLSFAPRGDGTYTMGILSEPEPPSSWTPTYREPVVSLFQGSVSYQYPFLTPPGPNGFAPNLALVYGSGAGNGQTGKAQSDPAGFGWQLSGLVEIAQGLRLCGLGDSVCPALTYQDAEGVHTGELQFTLSLDGTGYALVHKDGAASNGNPGRYHARGLASLYVEMCDHDNATPSLVCSSEASGNASEQVSRRYWVVKTGDNTTYRLGYTGNSEQEVVGMIPAADVENPAYLLPALRWQADYGYDRFGNLIAYTYLEDAAPISQTDPADNYAFTPASYIDHINYGLATITFLYEATGGFYDPDLNPKSLSWQTQHLTGTNIVYDGQPVRSYVLHKTAALHGHQNDNQYLNQTEWCTTGWEADSLTGWKHVMLTAITEHDASNQPRVNNRTDVTFDYVMRRTGQTFYNFPDGYFKFCYPYLDKVETLYHPADQPTAQFTYNPDDDAHRLPYYNNDGGPSDTYTHLSTVISQRLDSGWAADAPPQRTDFVYAQPDYGGRYVSSSGNTSNHYPLIFQGFQTATRLLFAQESDTAPQLREINHFLAYNYNEDTGNENPALNGRLQAQEIQDSDQRLRNQTGNEWALLNTGGSPQRQAVLMQTITTDILNGATNRTDYVYDAYGHQQEVREFGADLTGATPARTQETLYLANVSAAGEGDTWLVNLPWLITAWDADNHILSRTQLRYDNATCANPAALPNDGLLTHQDAYLPGAGAPPCDDWLVTRHYYGGAGGGQGAWWQLTRVVDPAGRWQQTYWDSADPTRISQSENSIGATIYAYTDANTPWLLTGSTQPNGGAAAYAYDSFGRLLELYAPDGATGDPTLTTEYEYYDTGIDGVLPLAIAEITYLNDSGTQTAVTRTFYDALGRPLQQRSWGSSSDFGITLVDYEYNGRGQLACQTAPVSDEEYIFNARGCPADDHTETQYNLFGQAVSVTPPDGVTIWQQALGQTQTTLNSLEQLHAAQQDALGRWGTVEELNPIYDGFPVESGPFDLVASQWDWEDDDATVNPEYVLNEQTVLKLKSNIVGGSGWHKLLWGSSYNLQPGNGVLLRFQLEQTNYEGRLSLSTGDLLNAVFVGLAFHGNQIYPDYNLGSGDQNFPGVALPQQAGVWYWLQMNVAADGVVSWRVWSEDDPDAALAYTSDVPAASLLNETFRFKASVDTHALYISHYQESQLAVTRYTYNLRGDLEEVTDAAGNATNIAYDELGRKLTMDDPDMGIWTYVYDDGGSLTQQRDARNKTLCFTYDAAGRLEQKYLEDAGDCDGLDANDQLLAAYAYHDSGPGLGQVETVLAYSGDVTTEDTFTYDYRGRVTWQSRTVDGHNYVMTTDYDRLDRPTQITYPNGDVVTPAYDRLYPDTLHLNGTPLVADMEHNLRGQPTLLERHNGVDTLFTYFDSGSAYRLQTLQHGSANDAFPNFSYAYDALGNILEMETHTAGGTDVQTFAYDALNRLVAAQAAGGVADYDHTYAYDLLGNMLAYNGRAYAYNDPNHVHAVTSAGDDTFTYDANGNMTHREDESGLYGQAFDAENRLIIVDQDGVADQTTFTYDANGQRVKTVHPDGRVVYTPFPAYEEESWEGAVTLTAEPPHAEGYVWEDEPLHLSWSSNFAACAASWLTGDAPDGQVTLYPDDLGYGSSWPLGDIPITLTCATGEHEATAAVMVVGVYAGIDVTLWLEDPNGGAPANPSDPGAAYELHWLVTNGAPDLAHCAVTRNGQTIAANTAGGSLVETGAPGNYTYTYTCQNLYTHASGQASQAHAVSSPALTFAFVPGEYPDNVVGQNDSITLSWQSNLADCQADDNGLGSAWNGARAAVGNEAIAPPGGSWPLGPLAFDLTCSRGAYAANASVSVLSIYEEMDVAVWLEDTAGNPLTTEPGDPGLLYIVRWQVVAGEPDEAQCTLTYDEEFMPETTGGSLTEPGAPGDHTYTFTCANLYTGYIGQESVTYAVEFPFVLLQFIPASPPEAHPGLGADVIYPLDDFDLAWSSNLAMCTAEDNELGTGWNGTRSSAGQETLTPPGGVWSAWLLHFTLTCNRLGYTAAADVHITVVNDRLGDVNIEGEQGVVNRWAPASYPIHWRIWGETEVEGPYTLTRNGVVIASGIGAAGVVSETNLLAGVYEYALYDGPPAATTWLDAATVVVSDLVYHVDAAAPPGGTGAAELPFQTLNAALTAYAVANASQGTVKVAAGHYTDTLTLPHGLALLGGYASQAGYTVRQPWQYPTHLHGSSPAAAAVLTITGTQVLVDGFFFQGGPSQPDTAIRVSPAVVTATTMLGHLAVDGFVYGVDASASAAIEYSLFTDNQIGARYVDASGWVYKSTFVEQSEQAVYVYHSDAPLPDPVVLVQDSILVNNAVALAGLPATGEVTVTGVNLLFWGNQTKLSGDAESKNDLNADPLFANPWDDDYHLYAASPAAYRGGDTYHLGAFGLVPNTTAAVTLSIEAYAPTAEPPVVCPVMVELATGNMATADVNENGQADDCFVGDYDALLTLPMPTQPTAPYGWYGAYVTFLTDAPDYEGPADQGGIWGYWRFNADANGHFLHIWPFWRRLDRTATFRVNADGSIDFAYKRGGCQIIVPDMGRPL